MVIPDGALARKLWRAAQELLQRGKQRACRGHSNCRSSFRALIILLMFVALPHPAVQQGDNILVLARKLFAIQGKATSPTTELNEA